MKLSSFSVPLGASGLVQFRKAVPEGRHLLRIGRDHLCARSRAFRLLTAHPLLLEDELDLFSAPNDAGHFAVGALTEGNGTVTPLSTAKSIRFAQDADVTEFAITIIDDYQGHGLGRLMLGVLATHAVLNGILELMALVHAENDRMLNLLDELDAKVEIKGKLEVEFWLPFSADPRHYPQSPAGDAFRIAYRVAKVT